MTDIINLSSLNLNHFTILDAQLYCQINNIKSNNVTSLYLNHNKLEDISGINIFKNLEILSLDNNQINQEDMNFLINLKKLSISGLNLTDKSKAVNILKTLNNLKRLWCINTFKTVKIRNEFKEINIYD